LNKFKSVEISTWDEIVNSQGKTMVSFWPKGSDSFVIDWV